MIRCCAYCGEEIEEAEAGLLTEDGFEFCSDACLEAYRDDGGT